MGLFREENFRVIVDPQILLIAEFKSLYRRDRTKEKIVAPKEFGYIYFVYDHRSPYIIYPVEERTTRVRADLKLVDWEVDSYVKAAIDKYLEMSSTPEVKTLTSIREGLLTSSKVIDTLRIRIEDALKDVDMEDIDPIVRSVQRMLEIAEKLPKAIDNISTLEDKIKRQETTDTKIRGGGKKGQFED